MPHLVFKNVEKEVFVSKAEEFTKKATEVIGCPEDWITLTYVGDTLTFCECKEMTDSNMFVEVNWFDRPQEIKDNLSMLIHNTFKKDGRDIMIIYNTLTRENYYENGTRP